MLVVADSSPIITLVNIQQINLLPRLFQRVIVPPAVAAELVDMKRPQAVQQFVKSAPCWLETLKPKTVEPIPDLDPGESEAISLARELNADLLLIDERTGYRAAKARGLVAVGFVGVLERAAREGLIDLGEAFNRLKGDPTIWINHELLDQRLELFLKQQQHRPEPEQDLEKPFGYAT